MPDLKSPTLRAVWTALAPWLAGISTLLYVCSRFVPATPIVFYGEIEDSYIQFLHTAFADRLQFGRDFVLNFGPWGFLYGGYLPSTHAISVIAWLGLALVFWWASWVAAGHLSKNKFAAWLWVMAFAAIAGLPVATMIDPRLTAFVVLLWLLYFFVEDRPFTAAQAALAVALGLLSLVKFNVLVESGMVLAVISADTVFRLRRFPWLLMVFAASVFLFWVGAGQALTGFPAFSRNVRLSTSGYTEGAMITGPSPVLGVGGFLLASLVVCLVVAYLGWRRNRICAVFPAGGLAFILFAGFKHGYVRHDSHEAAASLGLLLATLAVLAITWAAAANRSRWASLLPAAAVFGYATFTFSHYYKDGLSARLLETLSAGNILAPARLLLGKAHLREGYETYLANIRNDTPLPAIEGTVDNYPGNGALLMANGLHYRPRPIMQGLAAYTPELVESNAAFLRGPRAPDTIMFQIAPVDDHFPSLEDGRSWPELLSRYDVRNVEWRFVLLQRSITPRSWRLVPEADLQIRLGETVQIPRGTNQPVWAVLEIEQSMCGKIASALYKPPPLALTISTAGAGSFRYRLVPGMARGGFLLSPLVRDSVDFASLAGGELGNLADREVTSLNLTAVTESGLTSCYRSPARLWLYHLEYPPQDLSDLREFRDLTGLWQMLKRATVLRANHPLLLTYLPSCGSVLEVPADSALQVSVRGSPKRMQIGFGILPRPGVGAGETNGVTFRVSAIDHEGNPVRIWAEHLNLPLHDSGPATQQAIVDLSGYSSSEVMLETAPDHPDGRRALRCYWSRVELE